MNLLDKFPRLTSLKDPGAWTLIVDNWIINLPLAITIMQTAGLIFTIAGIQILVSRLVWPKISVTTLIDAVQDKNSTAAGITMLGLFVYNGLTTIALVIWLLYSLGLSSTAGN